MHGLVLYRCFRRARSPRSDRSERTLGHYIATERDRRSVTTVYTCGISEDARILAKRQILGSRIKVFDTMPRDVRDQCAGFRARPRFTPGFRGCDD
ncbi:hypothetical protein F2Q69_00021597 [Brassica cretica]|uniref:Uncharacterized protein n=1 Tax=Brassica cretica TaxID=69181 RepID=A0A8S9QHI8_BRACR|nr:hypothetical protein F2Q69_00021597 [Brassica cretica]